MMSHTVMTILTYVLLKQLNKFSLINGYLGYVLTAQVNYRWKFLNKTKLVRSLNKNF